MSALPFTRRYLQDYARNPVNILLLAVVPAVFVIVVAGSMANAAKLLGGPDGLAVQTATAGWAAALLAAIAMYFQTASTRDVDRRLTIAGLSARRLVAARLVTGLTLAMLASTASLLALVVRTGIDDPVRVIGGTLMFAAIYVAIGAAVGSLASNPVNGTVIVLLVWIVDIFLGPAMGAADRLATRALPTHFVTLWMVDLPTNHSSQTADLGWSACWTLAALLAAAGIVAARTQTRHARRRHVRRATRQWSAALRAAWRDGRRNPAQWALFVIVPAVFILAAVAVTPNKPITVTLDEHGHAIARTFSMRSVHAATMAPIAVASLAAVVGLFVLLDSRTGDRRATLAGLRPGALLGARFAVLALTAATATTISLAITAVVFHPVNWPVYAAANLLIALTYALIGALLAPIFGRVGGVFIAFLLPFLDLGVVQSPMLHRTPTPLSKLLPGYGGSRVLIDAALSHGFNATVPLAIGLGWLIALAVVVGQIYRNAMPRNRAASSSAAITRPSGRPAAAATWS
jgi:hypothetical protein